MTARTSRLRPVWLALLCGSLASGAALAATPPLQVRSVTITYSELDLARPEGARALYQRIAAAARRVCGPVDIRQQRSFRDFQKCTREAVENAVREVNESTLTALHRERTAQRWAG